MQATRTFPPEAVMKIGDTQPDIGEGLNAGVWTIGLSKTGNEMGLSEEDLSKLPQEEVESRVARADMNLRKCGAHYVVEEIKDVPPIIDLIEARLRRGDRP
jgi:phosphonoacetaldehyde hydrolase